MLTRETLLQGAVIMSAGQLANRHFETALQMAADGEGDPISAEAAWEYVVADVNAGAYRVVSVNCSKCGVALSTANAGHVTADGLGVELVGSLCSACECTCAGAPCACIAGAV